ncbi:hypothetical protein PYW07_004111 [Mythimna separata]|uniref:BPTI/Kunitz inhibitor domain-containing protein n=1 Tax=Mythimna separata TaxID=271217 RepID=A0AAD7YNF1_MYTSE|nr:hypothetical protein PYW07_004111 [Mythimna separata]
MKYGCGLQCYLFLTWSLLSVVRTVPPEYCLSPLNRSDCNGPPKTVFSYYKPGSRCEIETWRGCPTLNKFQNEYLCSLSCIFRMKVPNENPCHTPINQGKCGEQTSLVYTHINGICELVAWSGCPSPNKFPDKHLCEKTCQVETVDEMLLKLDDNSLSDITHLLEHMIEEVMTTTEATTEAVTEMPEDVTEAEEINIIHSFTTVGPVVTEPAVEGDDEGTTATEALDAEPTARPTTITEYNEDEEFL